MRQPEVMRVGDVSDHGVELEWLGIPPAGGYHGLYLVIPLRNEQEGYKMMEQIKLIRVDVP